MANPNHEMQDIAIRVLHNVDTRMGFVFKRAGELGQLPNVGLTSTYRLSKEELNRLLERKADAASITTSIFKFLDAAGSYIKGIQLNNTPTDNRLKRGTLKQIDGYIRYIQSFIDASMREPALRRNIKNLETLLNSQRSAITAIEEQISNISKELTTLYGPVQRQYENLKARFDEDLKHLDKKKKDIDNLTGVVTGKAITSSYLRSAMSERKIADDLRNGSMGFMIMVCIIVAISLVLATVRDFELIPSIFRMTFAILLSVPAAYLARESAKHRKQQYEYLQTALDVQAITPYIASLPDDKQHKLKEEVASRIFGTKNFDHITKESYPVNLQELIVATFEAAKAQEKKDSKTTKAKRNAREDSDD